MKNLKRELIQYSSILLFRVHVRTLHVKTVMWIFNTYMQFLDNTLTHIISKSFIIGFGLFTPPRQCSPRAHSLCLYNPSTPQPHECQAAAGECAIFWTFVDARSLPARKYHYYVISNWKLIKCKIAEFISYQHMCWVFFISINMTILVGYQCFSFALRTFKWIIIV